MTKFSALSGKFPAIFFFKFFALRDLNPPYGSGYKMFPTMRIRIHITGQIQYNIFDSVYLVIDPAALFPQYRKFETMCEKTSAHEYRMWLKWVRILKIGVKNFVTLSLWETQLYRYSVGCGRSWPRRRRRSTRPEVGLTFSDTLRNRILILFPFTWLWSSGGRRIFFFGGGGALNYQYRDTKLVGLLKILRRGASDTGTVPYYYHNFWIV